MFYNRSNRLMSLIRQSGLNSNSYPQTIIPLAILSRINVHPYPQTRGSLPMKNQIKRSFSVTSNLVELFLSSTPINLPGTSSSNLINSYYPFTFSIVLITLSIRTLITLPISNWSRRRINRFQLEVLPRFKVFESKLAQKIKLSSPISTKTKKVELSLEQKKFVKKTLKSEFKRLMNKYRCNPLPTSIVPLFVHIPVLFISTSTLHQIPQTISESHPISKEVLLYSSLIEPNLGLSVITWLTFLINLEINFSIRHLKNQSNNSKRDGSRVDVDDEDQRRKRNIIEIVRDPNTLRTCSFLAGIVMMGLSSTQPSLVLVYWLTSNCFSIFQSLIFNRLDKSIKLEHNRSVQERTLEIINSSKQRSSLSNNNSSSSSKVLKPPKI